MSELVPITLTLAPEQLEVLAERAAELVLERLRSAANHPHGAPATPLTIAEAATRLRLHENTIRRRIDAGTLPARKIAGRWRIQAGDLAVLDEEPAARTATGARSRRPRKPVGEFSRRAREGS